MEKIIIENPYLFIERRFNHIEALLIEIKNKPESCPTQNSEAPLNIEQAASFLGISKQTVYQNIERIPHKKRFGRLYFFQEELLAYINSEDDFTRSIDINEERDKQLKADTNKKSSGFLTRRKKSIPTYNTTKNR